MKQSTYTCDVCGGTKGAANHWYVVYRDVTILQIRPWGLSERAGSIHVCGERCMHLAISNVIEEWKHAKAV